MAPKHKNIMLAILLQYIIMNFLSFFKIFFILDFDTKLLWFVAMAGILLQSPSVRKVN
jgi:hypothetical protein